ncbi:MAG: insulinase family protein [Candidatus Rokubacteria bacterium]|nr:insulinase family protein [Candidatus Rokubacteria bacterium]
MEGEYRKSVLPDGIRLVTERMPHVRSVAAGIWVETGSRHEPEGRSGVSHFIEHLVFKGTETRTAEEIARAVDSVGGQMDAFTSKEHTCFYVNVLDQHVPLAVDLLADILLHARFAREDIEREKTVVLQEFRMVEDTPEDLIHDLFARRIWPDHPLGRPILGSRDVVLGLDREVILSHFAEEYCPARITIAVAGHVDHDRLVELFAPRFEGFHRHPVHRDGLPPVLTPQVDVVAKSLEQVHFVLGLPGFAHTAPERYALYLLNTILGGGMSSRLFQEVRERQGLVYSIYSGSAAFRDAGLLYIYAGTEAAHFPKVLRLVLDELARLRDKGITEEELARSREHLKGNLMLSLESTSSRMNRLAKQEIYFGQFFSLDEILAAVDAVTVEEVGRLIERLVVERDLSLVALGPVEPGSIARASLAL